MDQCIKKSGMVSDLLKEKIVRLDAYELIPTLVNHLETSSTIKDPYVLTVLCLLMRYNYDSFNASPLYKDLYLTDGEEDSYARENYKRSIPFTVQNYNSIIHFANAYYQKNLNTPSNFISIAKGDYQLGEKKHSTNPLRPFSTASFDISRYEITNQQFEVFVKSTGYITMAERKKDAMVFKVGLAEFEWIQDTTANWRYPNGKSQGGIGDKMNHPVTCISFVDAEAFCTWAGVRLPTIEEWEIASRGKTLNRTYFFGDSVQHIFEYANIWHGRSHLMVDDNEDFITTSPVGSFKPNPIGLYDMYGNVFEFCSNTPLVFNKFKNITATRGGSWWCSNYACGFFNSIDIGRVQKEASFSNNGFRVVR